MTTKRTTKTASKATTKAKASRKRTSRKASKRSTSKARKAKAATAPKPLARNFVNEILRELALRAQAELDAMDGTVRVAAMFGKPGDEHAHTAQLSVLHALVTSHAAQMAAIARSLCALECRAAGRVES